MAAYPNDNEFEDVTIEHVDAHENGYDIGFSGRGLFCPKYDGGEPKVGSALRIYSKGLGFRFRGLYVDGVRVFYRTEAEDAEHHEIELYGADAADWLKRWDDGRSVWSIEMGGLGPGYEQCIHVTAAEIIRHMLDAKYDPALWRDKDVWARDRDAIEKYGFANETIKQLGLSGAQWGAAVNLAANIYRDGPRKVMNDPRVKDRHIQVSRSFPGARAA